MSLAELQQKELLPHKFKYAGFAISGLCIVYALVYHYTDMNLPFEGLHTPNMIFVAGLIIAIGSKEAFEDERVSQIRSYAHSILSGLFVGYIFYEELDGVAESMISELSAFLAAYFIVFHFVYYFDAEWIVKNRGKTFFIGLLILVTLLISFDILWSA